MKKFLSSILAMLVVSLSLPHVAWAAVEGDTAGSEPSIVVERQEIEGLIYTLYDNNTAALTECSMENAESLTTLDIPATVTYAPEEENAVETTYTVTKIGGKEGGTGMGFMECINLETVNFPESVTSIGDEIFQNCEKITSFTIPKNLETLGRGALPNKLTSLTVAEGNTNFKVDDGVLFNISDASNKRLEYCIRTKTGPYTIPDDVKSIGDYAFSGCTGLTGELKIPDSVTSIGNGAFNGCSSLTSITIPDSVTSINHGTFATCLSLTEVTIPDSVTFMGHSAFLGCTGLTSVRIGNSVTTINSSTFQGCTDLTSVTIPNSVTFMGHSAFLGCTGLTSITIPDSVTSIDRWAFDNCSNLTTVNLYNPGATIGSYAFDHCGKLTTVNVPHNYAADLTIGGVKVSPTLHPVVKTNEKPATCTEDGHSEYYQCTIGSCKKYFSNENAKDEDEIADLDTWKASDGKISATGHLWDEGAVTKEPTTSEEGVRTYTCQHGCGETKTEAISKLPETETPEVDPYLAWGTKEEHNGHTMYVDAEGKTSALVTGNEKIWLREESYDPAAEKNLATWYMIDNTSGEFETGSRFWVKWLNNKDNPTEFEEHFNNMDQSIRDRVDSEKLWIFLIGVTKPDGITEYEKLSDVIPVYIQMGTDWNEEDIKAVYISSADDEEVFASYRNMTGPDGKHVFAELKLKHFSPYAIYDYLTDEEKAQFDKLSDAEKAELDNAAKELIAKQEQTTDATKKEEASNSSSSNSVKTGDESGFIIIAAITAAAIAGLYIEIILKKKKSC